MLKKIFSLFFILTTILTASDFGKIATGGVNGTYIQLGKDISRLFEDYNIKLEVIDTLGSAENIDLLINDISKGEDVYWAIVQKDALKYYKYKNPEKQIDNKIKTILPIYNEAIHIFVKKGNMFDINNSRNFKVAVSSKHSGSYITAQYLESAYGATFDYIFVDFNRAKQLILANEIDMYIESIAVGSDKFENVTDLDLLELKNNMQIEDTYIKSSISRSDYLWLESNKNIYTIPSIIITNVTENENNKSVEAFIKIILANYKNLQTTGNDKWKEIDFGKFKNIDSNYHEKALEIYKKLNLIN